MLIRELKKDDLFEQLNTGRLSVLKEIGANDLREEMLPAGKYCSAMAKHICLPQDGANLRTRAINTLKTLSPTKRLADFPSYDGAVIIGFNHPSLGEIFRLLYLGLEAYPDKDFLFPVNIPWYEAIVPIIPELKRLGIYITPMITPSTEKKLTERFAGDEERLKDVQHIKVMFERQYMRTSRIFAERGAVIVVAPSATRQAEVISDKIHPTMTLLSHMILKKDDIRVMFLPVAIIEPKINDKKFNPLKLYRICPCRPFYADEVKALSTGRDFDYIFLKRIEDIYKQYK